MSSLSIVKLNSKSHGQVVWDWNDPDSHTNSYHDKAQHRAKSLHLKLTSIAAPLWSDTYNIHCCHTRSLFIIHITAPWPPAAAYSAGITHTLSRHTTCQSARTTKSTAHYSVNRLQSRGQGERARGNPNSRCSLPNHRCSLLLWRRIWHWGRRRSYRHDAMSVYMGTGQVAVPVWSCEIRLQANSITFYRFLGVGNKIADRQQLAQINTAATVIRWTALSCGAPLKNGGPCTTQKLSVSCTLSPPKGE